MPVTPVYTTPTNVTAGEADSGKFNTETVDNIQHLFLRGPYKCTSATRPAGPSEGDLIYETDTDAFLFYNGAAWRRVTPAGGNTSGTTDGTGNFVFAHGLGYTPTQIQVTMGGSDSNPYDIMKPIIVNADASNIQIVLVNTNTGAFINGNPVNFWWTAR